MDWIRRNFPDLLIGLALLIVIGAIIATLLSGGSFLPFGSSNSTPDILPSSGSSITSPTTSPTTTTTGSVTVPDTTVSIPAGPVATPDGAAAPNVATDNTATNGITTANPSPLPVVVVSGTSTTEDSANNSATDNTVVASPNVANNINNTNTSSNTTVAVAASNAPYRISVGAFGNAANANKRVEIFKARGYPAFTAKQGSLTLVLVGPYNSESQAKQIAQDIKSSGLEPAASVIKFNPNATSSPTTSSSITTAVATVAPTTTPTTSNNLTAPVTSVAGSYLQVGAYNTSESAQALKNRLIGLGFSPQELKDSGMIKIVLGPYSDANLKTAKAVLDSNNLDSFVR